MELPQGIDADELVKRAAKAGVSIFSGKLSFAENAPTNFLRLAYSYSPPDRIARGVELVGKAYEQLLAEGGRALSKPAPRVA